MNLQPSLTQLQGVKRQRRPRRQQKSQLTFSVGRDCKELCGERSRRASSPCSRTSAPRGGGSVSLQEIVEALGLTYIAVCSEDEVSVLRLRHIASGEIGKAERATGGFPKRGRARRNERRAEGLVRERENEQVSSGEVGADLCGMKRASGQL